MSSIETLQLDELIITIGGALFGGAHLSEIETDLITQLKDLAKEEIMLREKGMDGIPLSGEVH